MKKFKTNIKNINIVEIVKNTIEEYEKALKSIDGSKIIEKPKFGERKNNETGKDEFYYKALIKI